MINTHTNDKTNRQKKRSQEKAQDRPTHSHNQKSYKNTKPEAIICMKTCSKQANKN